MESDPRSPSEPRLPVAVAVVDDFEIVVRGLAAVLAPHRDLVSVVELDANMPVSQPVDVALYDSFAQGEAGSPDLATLLASPMARHVAVFTLDFAPELVALALEQGAAGYLSKRLTGSELAQALVRVAGGEVVVWEGPSGRGRQGQAWPGRDRGLSERESEVLALVCRGLGNAEIARLLHLSINSVKTYVRTLYRKIGVQSRAQAVLWGARHGFLPDRRRIEGWGAGGEERADPFTPGANR